jgi:hypothetical protein
MGGKHVDNLYRFQVSAQPPAKKRPVKSKKKLMNIERPTSNLE